MVFTILHNLTSVMVEVMKVGEKVRVSQGGEELYKLVKLCPIQTDEVTIGREVVLALYPGHMGGDNAALYTLFVHV